MASTSAPPPPPSNSGHNRMKSAASTICFDYQSIVSEIRRTLNSMKEMAVDFEKDHKSDMVKELEASVIQLLEASDECTRLSTATQSVGNQYQPRPEPTDFKKLLDDEIAKSKGNSSSAVQNHPLLRQFREAVWNVHHAGAPMPGEEQEDIVMTSTHCSILNNSCPLTGKPVIELAEPVRSMDCKHVYEKKAIMQYMKSKKFCPMAGCPKALQQERVLCDPLLSVDIEEMRTMNREIAQPEIIEDFTDLF